MDSMCVLCRACALFDVHRAYITCCVRQRAAPNMCLCSSWNEWILPLHDVSDCLVLLRSRPDNPVTVAVLSVLCCSLRFCAGVVLSLGCLGFLLLLLGTRRRLVTAVAGLTCSTPVLVAIAALLSQPAWVGQGSARVAADGLQGLAAGFNLLVLLLLLLPSVKQWGPKAVSVGVWSGAAVGLLLCSGVAALCFGTPYCLHVHPTASGDAGSLWS